MNSRPQSLSIFLTISLPLPFPPLYCLNSVRSSSVFGCRSLFTCFLLHLYLPSPYLCSVLFTFSRAVSIVSLIFNPAVPRFLSIPLSFLYLSLSTAWHLEKQSHRLSEVLKRCICQHDSPIIACHRWSVRSPFLLSSRPSSLH